MSDWQLPLPLPGTQPVRVSLPSQFLLIVLLCCPFARVLSETRWINAADLTVEGRGWTDADFPFTRLPSPARESIPPGVWQLSRSSAGIAVRFLTRAPRIEVRWDLTQPSLSMPHMPATGVSGLDLYSRVSTNSAWRFVQNGRPTGQTNNMASFNLTDPAGEARLRECLLFLPLYNGVTRLELGVESALELLPAPTPARPVVVYGTSIVQGGCASRPGLAYTALLRRHLDRPIINLGFSGSGRMEPEVVSVVAELDPQVFVIDCLWNISGETPETVETRVRDLTGLLRKQHPTTPILFVGQSDFRTELHPTRTTLAQERAVRALTAAGVPGLHLLPGRTLLGMDGEGTVDGVHPNDIGMLRHAEALRPVLERLLRTGP